MKRGARALSPSRKKEKEDAKKLSRKKIDFQKLFVVVVAASAAVFFGFQAWDQSIVH